MDERQGPITMLMQMLRHNPKGAVLLLFALVALWGAVLTLFVMLPNFISMILQK